MSDTVLIAALKENLRVYHTDEDCQHVRNPIEKQMNDVPDDLRECRSCRGDIGNHAKRPEDLIREFGLEGE